MGGRWWGKRCARERRSDGFFSREVSLGGREREKGKETDRASDGDRASEKKEGKRERETARARSGVREGFWTAWYICDYTR